MGTFASTGQLSQVHTTFDVNYISRSTGTFTLHAGLAGPFGGWPCLGKYLFVNTDPFGLRNFGARIWVPIFRELCLSWHPSLGKCRPKSTLVSWSSVVTITMQVQSSLSNVTTLRTEQKWSHWTGGLITQMYTFKICLYLMLEPCAWPCTCVVASQIFDLIYEWNYDGHYLVLSHSVP